MKILITGHLGYIGSHLVKKIKKETNYEIIGIDILKGNDILDCKLPDVDVVIHLAAISDVIASVENPIETVRTNISGTIRLAEKYKNTKFIFASTGGAIQNEISSPYGLSKYCAEKFVEMLFSNYVILRFANIYGKKGSRSVVDLFLSQNKLTIYGDGLQTRTFIHIDDLLKAIVSSIKWSSKKTYLLGSHEKHTILELAKATGKSYTFAKYRPGELQHANVKNTTPNWKSTINIIDYINKKNHEK